MSPFKSIVHTITERGLKSNGVAINFRKGVGFYETDELGNAPSWCIFESIQTFFVNVEKGLKFKNYRVI